MGSGVLGHDVANRMVERTLSDGRLTLIAGAGHSVMMDNPTEFTASVAGFLAGVAAQKQPANDGYRRSRNA
jgi:pimeloyl-ACP methyl ester carboxylesterase